eukprot:5511678-Pleurochrysis_carterae.AAC.1
MAATSKTWRPPIISVVPLSQTASWALLGNGPARACSDLAPPFCPFPRSAASLPLAWCAEAPGRVSALVVARRPGKAARMAIR